MRISYLNIQLKVYTIVVLLYFNFNSIQLGAQSPCFTNETPVNRFMGYHPKAMDYEDQYRNASQQSGIRDENLLTIPIVVHVIHQIGSSPSLTEDKIISQVQRINGILKGNSLCPTDPESINTNIELCLAKRQFNNLPTTAVNFIPSDLVNLNACSQDADLKDMVRNAGFNFPDSSYLNIYIVDAICAPCNPLGCEVAGYATYPAAHGTASDGIVIKNWIWQEEECHDIKIFLHELGHYLNLLHTFSDNCNNDDCLSDGDKVCDTPPAILSNQFPTHPCMSDISVNSCSTDVNSADLNNPFSTDQFDVVDNLMSYSPRQCMSEFTLGQSNRMRFVLKNIRSSLLRSKACLIPCDNPIIWEFNVQDVIQAGITTTIENLSSGSSSFGWEISGQYVESVNLTYVFDTSGEFQIKVFPLNVEQECADTLHINVVVKCPIEIPTFHSSTESVSVGEEVVFTNSSIMPGDLTFTWYIENEQTDGENELSRIFEEEGSYRVYLEACNEYCCVRSDAKWIQVGTCKQKKGGTEWHFGRFLGLKFSEDGTTTEIPSAMRSYEAAAIAYDDNGEVLFYSNGSRVWNREHQIMINGNRLAGHESATQALAVKQPGSKNIWFLFYSEASMSGVDRIDLKMFYAKIDISKDGGRGEVIEKDIVLFNNTTEKVTAIKHCNNIDWWVIMHEHGNSNFRIYQLDKGGLNNTPMIQAIGSVHNPVSTVVGGFIKANQEGNMIAVSKIWSVYEEDSGLELLKFDRSLGLLSDPLVLWNDKRFVYGVEFSRSANKLYTHDFGRIYQFDLSNYSEAEIKNSEKLIGELVGTTTGGFIIGPDDIIYVNTTGFTISAILNPDSDVPEARLVEKYLTTQERSLLGVPNLLHDVYKTPEPKISGPTEVCDTNSLILYNTLGECNSSELVWSIFGDAEIQILNSDSVYLTFFTPGEIELISTNETACGNWSDTLQIIVNNCRLEPCPIILHIPEADTIVCSGEPAYVKIFSNAEQLSLQELPDGPISSIGSGLIDLGNPDSDKCYQIRAENAAGCDTTFQFCVSVNPDLTFNWIQSDTTVCFGEIATIDFSTNASIIEVISRDGTFHRTQPVFPLELGPFESDSCYLIRLSTPDLGCDTLIYFCVHVTSIPEFQWLNVDSISCGVGEFSIDFVSDAFSYSIINGTGVEIDRDFNLPYVLNQEGDYQLILETESGECNHHISFSTRIENIPAFEWIFLPDSVCPGESLEATFNTDAFIIQWVSNGDTLSLTGDKILFENILDDTCFTLLLESESGCRSTIDTCVLLNSNSAIFEKDLSICPGDSIQVFGNWVSSPGVYLNTISIPGKCDSIEAVDLSFYNQMSLMSIVTPTCEGDQNGKIELTIRTGSGPFSIDWSHTGDEDIIQEQLPAGEYKITITDANGCHISQSFFVDIQLMDEQIIELVHPVCSDSLKGKILLLSFNSHYTYSLDGEVFYDDNVSDLIPGSYRLQVISDFGCIWDSTIVINEPLSFELSLPDEYLIFRGQRVALIPEINGSGNLDYHWSPPGGLSCIDCREPFASPLSTTMYTLIAENQNGCIESDSVIVFVDDNKGIYIPTAFSPNGDGVNDEFQAYYKDTGTYISKMRIYDRWGTLIYDCKNQNCSWDGKHKNVSVLPGIYIYYIELTLPNGSIVNKEGEIVVMM
jgi:gliding motility-associated-like protein